MTFMLVVLGILTVQTVQADTIVKGNNTTILSSGGSWVGGVVPTSSNIAQFDHTITGGTTSANVGTGLTVGGIVVTDTGVSFTVDANGTKKLTIGASGLDMSSAANGSNDFTIVAPIVLDAAQTFNVANGRTLTLSGTINNSGDTLTFAGSGTVTQAGVISGAGGIVMAANGGTTTMGAVNTYTGDTTVRAGTLAVDGNAPSGAKGRLGNSSNSVDMGDSGTSSGDDLALIIADLSGGSKIARTININNYGNSTTLGGTNTSGTNTFSGDIVLSKDVIVSAVSGGTVTFTGIISGTGNITKNGDGIVGISGTNTYSGNVIVNGGTLAPGANNEFDQNGSLTVNNGATFSIAGHNETVGNITLTNGTITSSSGTLTASGMDAQSGTLSAKLAGTYDFIKSTNGTVTVSANNNAFTGNIIIRDGTLQADTNNNALGTGTVTLGDASTQGTDDLALLINQSGRTFSNNITVANYGNSSTLGGNYTSGTGTYSGTIVLNKDTFLNQASGGTLNITGNINGSVNLNINGGGTVSLSGTNSPTMGSVTISAGTLNVNSGNAISDTSAVTVGSGATFGVVGSETIGSLVGAGGVALSNSKVLTVGDNNQNSTYSGAMTGTAGTGLTKEGAGTLTLSGANTYLGTTTVNSGTVLLDLSSNPTGVMNSTSKLTLGGGNFVVQGQSGGASSQTLGTFALTANTSSHLTVNGAAGTGTTLTLSNTWNIGAGSVLNIDLSAANSFLTSSPTQTNAVINAAVTVTDGTTTGFGTVSGGNIVRLTPTNLLTSAVTTSTADYYLNTGGTLVLAGTETINSLTLNGTSAGTLDFNGGRISVLSNGILSTNSQDYVITNGTLGANNKDLVVHQMGAGSLTLDTVLTGSNGGSLTKDGNGALILTQDSTFGSATMVHAGTLQFGNATNSGSVAGAIVNNATLIFNNPTDRTHVGDISGLGTVTKTGAGTDTLTGNNSYTGTTTISQGTLNLAGAGGNQALGGTHSIIVTSGGTLALSTDDQVNDDAPVTLAGGTISVGANEGAGGAPGIGALTLTANSTLELGSAIGVIAFADSSTASWANGTILSVSDWAGNATVGGGNNQVYFGLSNSGLTASQVAQIKFINPWGSGGTWDAKMLSTGEVVVALPEPDTYVAGAALVALAAFWELRRRKTARANTFS